MFPDFTRPPVPPQTSAHAVAAVVGPLLFAAVLGVVMGAFINFLFGAVIGLASGSIALLGFRLYNISRNPRGRSDSDYDSPDAPRLADLDERQAYRALRRGRITRFQYERVVTRRKYAHGDLTHSQFEAVMSYIGQAEAGQVRSTRL